jgi:hypothetical protein
MKNAVVVCDEVVVAILTERDRESTSPLHQIDGDLQLGQVSFALERRHS